MELDERRGGGIGGGFAVLADDDDTKIADLAAGVIGVAAVPISGLCAVLVAAVEGDAVVEVDAETVVDSVHVLVLIGLDSGCLFLLDGDNDDSDELDFNGCDDMSLYEGEVLNGLSDLGDS